LCVDLDGTLVRTDLLHEAIIAFVKTRLIAFFVIVKWVAKGRLHLKLQLAQVFTPDVAHIPYRTDVVDFIKQERARGRKVYLVTASPQNWADAVGSYLGCFDEIIGTSQINLKGAAKAELLKSRFGESGFDYIGDHPIDRDVWKAANLGHGAGRKAHSLISSFPESRQGYVFDFGGKPLLRSIFTAIRPHQWSKNILLFVSIAAAHRLLDVEALNRTVIGFLAFSLIASATYLINDLVDLETDRVHPRKRFRPLAAGELSVALGAFTALLLAMIGLGLSLLLPSLFTFTLAVYVFVTLAYSMRLKRAALADVLTLAGLYTLRIIAGTIATNILISSWLLAFSMFTFIALAISKRCAELTAIQLEDGQRLAGRGYYPSDLEVLCGMASASSFCASLVLAIYTTQSYVFTRYSSPELLWLLCPILIFILNRILILARRGQMDDDPIVFCAHDLLTLKLVLVCVVTVVSAKFIVIDTRLITGG
jgi:4-hydroxybenzoate polyprenyltransferase